MVSKKIDSSLPPTAADKLRRNSSGRLGKPDGGGSHRLGGGASVSEKLEALKSLVVPSGKNEEAMKPEKLFKETADYIVLLRTQVLVLQKLIDFYGSEQPPENPNSVQ